MDYQEIYNVEHVKNGLSYKEIREKYSIPRGTWDYYVRVKLNKSCDLRQFRANDCFFDTIDCEVKAYLLGFLYADGYLTSDGRVGIRLNQKDREIVELIKEYICPHNPIEFTNNQNLKRDPQVSIRFKSKRIYKRLIELGFTVEKTKSNSSIFNNIPDLFKVAFIRGFTDGDGCLGFYKNKTYNTYKVSLAYSNGSVQLLNDINSYFGLTYGGIIKDKTTWFTLRFDKKKESSDIIHELYSNSNFHLTRKKLLADSIIKYCNNTELN